MWVQMHVIRILRCAQNPNSNPISCSDWGFHVYVHVSGHICVRYILSVRWNQPVPDSQCFCLASRAEEPSGSNQQPHQRDPEVDPRVNVEVFRQWKNCLGP